MLNAAGCEADAEGTSVTVTVTFAALTSSAAGITACNCVGLTKVVASGVSLKLTTEAALKFAPVAVICVSEAPAVASAGAIAVS